MASAPIVKVSVRIPVPLLRALDELCQRLGKADPEHPKYTREDVILTMLVWLMNYKRIWKYREYLVQNFVLSKLPDPFSALWSDDA